MTPNDDLRGAYKQFLISEAGKDLLLRIVTYEAALQTENYAPGTSNEKKVSNTDKMAGLYWVRTQLDDLSKPKPKPSVARRPTQSGPR
jgi:hypothetical protein